MAAKKKHGRKAAAKRAARSSRSSPTPEELEQAHRTAQQPSEPAVAPAELEEPTDPTGPAGPELEQSAGDAPDTDAARAAIRQLRASSAPAPAAPAGTAPQDATGEAWSPGSVARPERPAMPSGSPVAAPQGPAPAPAMDPATRERLERELGPRPTKPDGSRDWAAERAWRERRKQLGLHRSRGDGAARGSITRTATPHTMQPQPVQVLTGTVQGQPTQPMEPSPRDIERTRKMWRTILRVGSRFMARRRGQHWLLPTEDLEELSDALGEGTAPYVAAYAEHAPLAMGAIALGAVIQERLEMDEQLRATGTRPTFPPIRVEVESAEGTITRWVEDPRNRQG